MMAGASVAPGFAAAVARLKAAGVDTPRLDARVLWQGAQAAGGDAAAVFQSMLARRAAREPVAYIVGRKEFWGLEFAVGPGVLVPRPDTETVVEAVLSAFPDRYAPLRLLDLGTGSGCILAALLHEYPSAHGVGVEASVLARGFAEANFSHLGLSGRVELRAADWCDGISGLFDVAVCNPPYIPTDEIPALEPEVSKYEPTAALDGGPDGLAAYRVLFALAGRCLAPRGQAFFEIGQGQENDLCALAGACGTPATGLVPDLAGIPRVLAVKRP